MADRKRFTLKDSDQMIIDVIDEFFEGQAINYDLKELLKANLLGSPEEIPQTGLEVVV